MTISTNVQAPAPLQWPRVLLAAIAAAESISAVSDLPGIVAPLLDETPTRFLLFAQVLLSVKFALAPFLAIPALILAVKNRMRAATLCLAGLLLLTWLLDDTTSFVIHGAELSLDFGGITVAMRHFLYPLLGVAGGALALARRQTALAAVLVSLPTLANWLGFAIFAAAILIHGF